ncbi:neprilysin-2-like isoform X2 [Phymastichus coffea]|uniref:neprilysin-2-like isoform X2 n=1 Tax=Phymastichus coffea TaxID=108790 RepID=UPI00273BD279|nr:neprilysin-2-like isoform X2 [Phymastichus coffea]
MSFNTSVIMIILILKLWIHFRTCANPGKNEEIKIKREVSQINSDSKCTSIKCLNESIFYLNNMDLNVDPCNNFYTFACGGFLNKSSIPKEEFLVTQYGILNKKIEDELINELNSGPHANDLEAFKVIKSFYMNCINETRIENDGITPILELLDRLGGWPVLTGDKWNDDDYRWENIVSLISNIAKRMLNAVNIFLKLRGPILEVDNGYNMTDENSKQYINFMTDIAVLLGANNETAFNDMRECLKFELKLFKVLYSTDETYSFIPTEKSIKEWTEEFPDISWLSLLNKIFKPSDVTIDENDMLLIDNTRYVATLAKLLNNTSKRIIANHQLWRILYYDITKFTPMEFRSKYENFKKSVLNRAESLPREYACLNFLQHHSPVALNSLYIHKFVNKNSNFEQLNILKNVKNQMKKYFKRLGWIDEELRNIVLEKIDTLTAFIGYPEELLNNTIVEDFYKESSVNLENALYSYANITRVEKNFSLRLLRYAHRAHDWAINVNVPKVGANYDSDSHRINVLAGIAQSPFFDLDRPKYLNYGGLGFVIGHEIIHGINTNDVKRKHAVALKSSTIKEYQKRETCIMKQFSNYTISQVYGNVDGERTYTENIADGGGFRIGYYAYNSWVESTNTLEPHLPGLNYTPQQMYWIGIASALCSKIKDVSLPDYLRDDLHSPDEARINVGFSNVEEFAKDFNCPVGSTMNPAQKCVVW